jgi:Holliday junction resolvase RusA-like endonuclease
MSKGLSPTQPSLLIIIPGKPIAKARPRFFRRGNYVGTYNIQETEEGRWILEAKAQLPPGWTPLEGAIEMQCVFGMPIPKSMPKKLWEKCDVNNGPPHIKKPDLDNLIKFVKDCLRGIAYRDDAQITFLSAGKTYVTAPGTMIAIREWPEEKFEK